MKITRRQVIEYLQITVGTAITASGINGFYAPNHIADGGVSGIGIILQYLLHVPIWLTLAVINLPLLWLSHRLWGGRVGVRTLVGTVLLSVWVGVLHWHPFSHNVLLAAIYGGMLSGVGLGLVFRARGTTGGTDVVARFFSHIFPISMGQAMMVIDFFVIAGFGVTFDPTKAMYSLIALFISSRAIDVVQEGTDFARAFTIITAHPNDVASRIMLEIGRGVTRMGGRGAYTGEARSMLYVVVLRSEVTRVKSLVYEVDPDAFVVVANVHEVIGEGFRSPPVEE
ncbi:YitT family protein [Sulfobacillus harzensis]|uniref:YitT family protein n=1 Tax=Sulfobacillus harzensis TaxID=2729629 RepID=A0A7Y0Q113_9FIRM|nr:YitT family protein [Sulfobacillus harzensis]NMP20987.1 YitT family protein [Sulfobacillus harzensis]